MVRTKNQIRGSKSKGAQMEYSVADSLRPIFPDILVTKQLGFVSQYDLVSKDSMIVIECKKHKGFSWNELMKYFIKLEEVAPEKYKAFVIFKSNHQPCLVMYRHKISREIVVSLFYDVFELDFIKHVGKKKVITE